MSKSPDLRRLSPRLDKEEVRWPLSFRLDVCQKRREPRKQESDTKPQNPKSQVRKCWWSHRLYRGPSNEAVEVLYSKTVEDSERLARRFLGQKVVGFDMEWPWNDWKRSDLQNKIGLIQIASEKEIALFHIGLHVGKTADEIIAPSLRQLIEDPNIGKLGVGILNADFARIRRFFGLKPRGAVELSHLYRLVKFGADKPHLVSTKLVSLARLVEDQLGHPLYKGDVRTSNWSKPLSQDQINYAAADAYAGLMLYHCMNYKRLQMKPVPPMPVHAEVYLGARLSGIVPLRLESQSDDGSVMTSETFFGVQIDPRPLKKKKQLATAPTASAKLPKELTDDASRMLFVELAARRAALAQEKDVPVFRVSSNAVLVALACQKPTDSEQLLQVKGIGKHQQKNFGSAWLEVICHSMNQSETSNAITSGNHGAEELVATAEGESNQGRNHPGPSRSRVISRSSSESSCAFKAPLRRTPQLHTGLSFSLAETQLSEASGNDSTYDTDDSLPYLDWDSTRPPKRRRTGSLTHESSGVGSSHANQSLDAHDANAGLPSGRIVGQSLNDPMHAAPVPNQPPSPSMKIARNKLLAFSKLVTRRLVNRPKDAPPIVSDRTISLIVTRAPQTQEELERIPGIDAFLLACQTSQMDLLRYVVKFAASASCHVPDVHST